jgi:hypothetical protein
MGGAPVRIAELFIAGTAGARRAKMKTAMPGLKRERYANQRVPQAGGLLAVSGKPPRSASVICRKRVDDLRHFGDAGHWDATQFGVLVDRGFILGEINAEGFLSGDIAVLPLNVRADLVDGLI